MIYAYMGRNGKLCLRPADPEGEEELKDFLKQYKQSGIEAIDIETEMPDDEYKSYQQQRQRYGYRSNGNKQSFGFAPTSYFPMPPDFGPQSHFYPPVIWPIWLSNGGYDGYSDRNRGTDNLGDSIVRSERGGDYDGRSGNENPRDTGRRDIPRR